MKELQKQIGEWHIEEFGEYFSNKALAKKLLEEAAEFMVERVPEEAADILILLMAWAHRNNVDLIKEAVKKFEIVKNRNQKERDNL